MGGKWVLADWLVVTACAAAALFVVVLFLRSLSRRSRVRRFAKREGLVWLGKVEPLPRTWKDIACFRLSEKGRTVDCVAGERSGRPFAILEHHYGSDGPEMRPHASMALFWPALWFFQFCMGQTQDAGFSAAVVECTLPPQRRTLWVKRDLAPWRVEFGSEASVIRRDDGYASPADLLDAVDRLNGVLDELLAAPSPSVAT